MNLPIVETVSVRLMGHYWLVNDIVDDREYGGDGDLLLKRAYSLDGDYIGTPKWAHRLMHRYGVIPERPEGWSMATIGRSVFDGKWYGWTHRAIYGYGIGHTVAKGSVAYKPGNWQDFREDCVRFWTEPDHCNIQAHDRKGPDGRYVHVSWELTEDAIRQRQRRQDHINARLRRQKKKLRTFAEEDHIGGADMQPPQKWGRGEWTARTEADCRQMAIDHVEGCA